MNYLKKNLEKILLIVFTFLLPFISFAQNNGGSGDLGDNGGGGDLSGGSTTIINPLTNSSTLGGLIETILRGVIKLGMPILVLAIIYSGFLFVSAQGNTEKLSSAKRSLLYTLIGAAILLGSWGIAQLISETVLSL